MNEFTDSSRESYSYSSKNDLFVEDVLQKKSNGWYVDIGSQDPLIGNNTYLFEKNYGWSGLSIEKDKDVVEKFNEVRTNKAVCADATTFNYYAHFQENSFPKQIDYLSIDIDGGFNFSSEFLTNKQLTALVSLPLNQYRFSIIHFEHGYMENVKNKAIRDTAREVLNSFGYGLIGRMGDEDWWLDTKHFDWSYIKNYFYVGKHSD